MKATKTNIKFVLLTIFLLNLISCKKDEIEQQEYSIKYVVESGYHWDVNIQWTGADGGINGKSLVESDWTQESSDVFSYSFVAKQKLNILFQGENTNSLSDVKIRLYVHGNLVQSAEANSQMKATINYQL
jgi:hypothetical protein